MSIELSEFFKDTTKNAPISQNLALDLLKTLPSNYVEFLQFSNGIEGTVSNGSYLQMWAAEDLNDINAGYKVKENVPGMYLVGSDGGDEAIGIDLRKDSTTYGFFFRVPFIPLTWKEAIKLGPKITDIKIV